MRALFVSRKSATRWLAKPLSSVSLPVGSSRSCRGVYTVYARSLSSKLECDTELRSHIQSSLSVGVPFNDQEQQIRSKWKTNSESFSATGYVTMNMWATKNFFKNISRRIPVVTSLKYFGCATSITIPWMALASDEITIADYTNDASLIATEVEVQRFISFMSDNNEAVMTTMGFLSTALFLILSFRVHRAVDRWAQARQIYGSFIADARSLAQGALVYVKPSSPAVAIDVSIWSYILVRCTEFHLRQCQDSRYTQALGVTMTQSDLKALLASPNRPAFALSAISRRIRDAHNADETHGIRATVALQTVIERLQGHIEDLHRIQSTPEPQSYQMHLRFTTMLWIGLLPVALLPALQWGTPFVATSIAFVLFKLDDVAVEVQHPFGFDHSDLNICQLNDELQTQLLSTLLDYTVTERQQC